MREPTQDDAPAARPAPNKGHRRSEVAAKASPAGYTCPMHPEVRQPGPGSCPKRGMALEPLQPVAPSAPRTAWTCSMHPEVRPRRAGELPYLRHEHRSAHA
jgi:Cu+-exporting ATPase